MKPGQMVGPRWRETASGLLSSSTPCWSRTLAVKSWRGDSTARGLTSCPKFNFSEMARLGNTFWLSYAFYREYRTEEEIFIPCFVLTIDKEGLRHWMCVSRTCLGSEEAEKSKGNILNSFQCSPLPPEISAPLFSHLAFEHFFLKPASSCFYHCHNWASKSQLLSRWMWKMRILETLATYVVPDFYYYICMEIYMYTF